MEEKIIQLLMGKGYEKLYSQSPIFWSARRTDGVYIVGIHDGSDQITIEQLDALHEKWESEIMEKLSAPVKILHIFVVDNGMLSDHLKEIASSNMNIWFLTRDLGETILFENQSKSFDGLYDAIEQIAKETQPLLINEKKRIPWVTIVLVLSNLLVFAYMYMFCSNERYNDVVLKYAMRWEDVFYHFQIYRLGTAMFLHFGIEHLIGNMTALTLVGYLDEKEYGSIRMLFLYFGAGLAASIGSCIYHAAVGDTAFCAGASGAIYGLIGAYVVFLLGNLKDRKEFIRNMVIMVVLSGVNMFTDSQVDHVAHICGFLAGALIGFIYVKIFRRIKKQ